MFTQIIDYRNARYQGQTKNNLPHGLGIMFDYQNLFTLAEWKNGQIHGYCLIIFGDSKIFYGSIRNTVPDGICTYHLKDKTQIFCNFTQKSSNPTPQNFNQINFKTNRLVALLPSFNMIIKVQGDKKEELIISDEQVYRQKDMKSIEKILQNMLNLNSPQNDNLDAYFSIQSFIHKMFTGRREYEGLLDTVQLPSADGGFEIFFTLKTVKSQSSLGIRIQNCLQNQGSNSNFQKEGHSYIIKAVGMFNKEGILEYGLKNIKTLIKCQIKEEAIYSDEKTIIRYENESSRPKKCAVQIMNFLKKSPYFTNKCIPTRHLYILQAECVNINFNIQQSQTKKFAQIILQNPKQLTIQEKTKIEQARSRKVNNGSIQKNTSQTPSKIPLQKNTQKFQKQSQQLQKTRQDIYRSVSKKKINEGKSFSPYSKPNNNESLEKELKPAELTNVKPILQLYKKTNDNSFYNSINKNDSSSNLTQKKNSEGYQFSITKNIDPSNKTKTPQPKYTGSMSADYIKSLQNRRRLYQESDFNRMPSVTQQVYNGQTSRRKFNYLPDESQQISSRPVTHKLLYQKRIENSLNNDTYDNDLSIYAKSRYDEPQTSVYDPHKHFHDHSIPLKSEENYFRSHRRQLERSRSIQKNNDQTGKLGRRTTNRQKPIPQQNSLLEGLRKNPSKKKINLHQPIIVPEFKISHTNSASQYKMPIRQDSLSPNPKRQHEVKLFQQDRPKKSPLKTQAYRKQYLETNSPIKKLGSSYNESEPRYKYEYDVVMDPGVNFARTRLQRETNYLNSRKNDRQRSPIAKRRKILSDNPFDI